MMLKRVHIEDFASVLGRPASTKYDSSYFEVGRAIELHCRNKGLDLLFALEVIVLSYVLGNNDLHLKNFSLLDRGEYYTLSPLYDVVCAALKLLPDNDGSLEVQGFYTADDFLELATQLGLERRMMLSRMRTIIDAQPQIEAAVANSFLLPPRQKAVSDIIRRQFDKLKQGRCLSSKV